MLGPRFPSVRLKLRGEVMAGTCQLWCHLKLCGQSVTGWTVWNLAELEKCSKGSREGRRSREERGLGAVWLAQRRGSQRLVGLHLARGVGAGSRLSKDHT